MKEIIDYTDLPDEKKLYSTACPHKDAFKELKGKDIFDTISEECETEEELEKAVSGAFIGWHIINHLIQREHDPEVVNTMLIEMLGTYSEHDTELNGHCWTSLKRVLTVFGFKDFYQKGIDYIIKNRGELD